MQADFAKWFKNFQKKYSLLSSVPANLFGMGGLLTREDSVAILRSLSPRLEKTPEEELNTLAARLGDQQVSLVLAGRYLSKFPRISISQYLVEIEKTISTLDDPLLSWAKEQTIAHALDLAAQVVIALQSIQNDSFGQKLFTAAGFCAPGAAIPLKMMRRAVGADDKRQAAVLQSLDKLYQLGLLEPVDEEPAIVFPLVDIARLMGQGGQSILANLADAMIELSQPGADPAPSQAAWAHFQPVAEWSEQSGLKQAGKIWNALGYHLTVSNELQEAQEFLERALTLEETNVGPVHPDLAIVLNNLGRARADAGNLTGARACFERVLEIDEKIYTPGYPGVAADANNLGEVLYSLGDLAGAKSCFQRAMTIHENALGFGPNHPIVAKECLNLGRVMRHMGRLDEAIQFYERALSINEWVYGMQHTNVADSCGQLGKALYARGDLSKARACFERQLLIEESTKGVEDSSVAITLNNLGLTLQDLGELGEARIHFERALSIDEQAFGKDHTSVARDLNNLGCAVREMGDLLGASLHFKRALSIHEQTEGERAHWRDISTTANNLGRVLYSLDDLDGARDCFNRVLSIDKKIYGSEAAEVATDLTNLGTVYLELDDLPAAKSSYERALTILSKIFPSDHQKVVTLQRYVNRLNKVL